MQNKGFKMKKRISVLEEMLTNDKPALIEVQLNVYAFQL